MGEPGVNFRLWLVRTHFRGGAIWLRVAVPRPYLACVYVLATTLPFVLLGGAKYLQITSRFPQVILSGNLFGAGWYLNLGTLEGL